MLTYILVGLGVLAIVIAFVFRFPAAISINEHSVDAWLLVLIVGLILCSTGLIRLFRAISHALK